jgi:hypothetical protein
MPDVTDEQCRERSGVILDAVKEVSSDVRGLRSDTGKLRVAVESHLSMHQGKESAKRSLFGWIGAIIGVVGVGIALIKAFWI